jgi:dTMP kinase
MKKLNSSLLIVIEGIDGSGKTSLAKGIKEELKNQHQIVLTKEPGGTQLGKMLRKILQEQDVPVCPKAEFLLFAADRAQHFKTLVLPELKLGKIVISDRMGDSSVCYQGYGRGLDINEIKQVNKWATSNRKADLTLFVDIDVEEAFKRIYGREDDITVFEKKELIQKVQFGFKDLYKNRNDVVTLDGTAKPEELVKQAVAAINKLTDK